MERGSPVVVGEVDELFAAVVVSFEALDLPLQLPQLLGLLKLQVFLGLPLRLLLLLHALQDDHLRSEHVLRLYSGLVVRLALRLRLLPGPVLEGAVSFFMQSESPQPLCFS